MSDAVAQRRDNFRRYWIQVVVGDRQVWARWSYLGIPNFILVAFNSNTEHCRGWVEHLELEERQKVIAKQDTKLVVCGFSSIRSQPRDGSRCFDHVVTYAPIEQPPALVTWRDWREWKRANDTEGDILSPRVDPSER